MGDVGCKKGNNTTTFEHGRHDARQSGYFLDDRVFEVDNGVGGRLSECGAEERFRGRTLGRWAEEWKEVDSGVED